MLRRPGAKILATIEGPGLEIHTFVPLLTTTIHARMHDPLTGRGIPNKQQGLRMPTPPEAESPHHTSPLTPFHRLASNIVRNVDVKVP